MLQQHLIGYTGVEASEWLRWGRGAGSQCHVDVDLVIHILRITGGARGAQLISRFHERRLVT